MTGAMTLQTRNRRNASSLRLDLAWVDLQLSIAAVLFSVAALPMVLWFGQSRWAPLALGVEAAFSILLLGVRLQWRRRVCGESVKAGSLARFESSNTRPR
jgi:hypothetical protein